MMIEICRNEFEFDNFNEVADYFKKMINICLQMNYSEFLSEEFQHYRKQFDKLVKSKALEAVEE